MISTIYNHVDHTNLRKNATEADIEKLCEEAILFGAKSVCVQPCYVSYAKNILRTEKPLVCTVIGFPNGYSATEVKCFEAEVAILQGASEIDMVINNCWMRDKKFDKIRKEIRDIAKVCHQYNTVLKVIIETCMLTKNEISLMCEICIETGADYIKTSTGFDSEGAQVEDIRLMHKTINSRNLKIKASGGIRTIKDAQRMLDAGADRIGASSIFV